MTQRYKEFRQLDLPAIEKEILAAWEHSSAFEESVRIRDGSPAFVFYEGPPSANGLPGIHHVIGRTLKDLVCRYKTMSGFQVDRKGGWDTHGLPVELGVEKELGITKEDIGRKISIAEYNSRCREAVLRYKSQWDELTRIMGFWVDLSDPYVTFNNEYIETLWWLLSELYKKGLLYESVSIQPYSPAAGTGLSSHELNYAGTYRKVKDTSAVVMFKAIRDSRSEFLFNAAERSGSLEDNIFFLAWTTTPWTLPSNLGLTVGPQIQYVLVKTFNPYNSQPIHVVLAKDLVGRFFKAETAQLDTNSYSAGDKEIPWTVLEQFDGSLLEEIRYEQLLPFEANKPEVSGGDPFRVMVGDFVTTEDGTGIVHTAPAFGADDFRIGKKYGIGILTMVDREGKFVEGLGEFSNRYVKNYRGQSDYSDVNVDICVKLKKEGRAFKIEKYEHNYPHCWRTDKPLLYYPLDAWFIKTTAKQDRMIQLNNTINWKPRSTGEGRFGNWLENMVDWNLSRSRYWGTPLPIWKTEDGAEVKCIGTIAELKDEIAKADKILGGVNAGFLSGKFDLHRPYIDQVILVSNDGRPMQRVPDLIDVWFDSGSMPFAQWGLPDTSSNKFGALSPENFWEYHAINNRFSTGTKDRKLPYPADFIAEGVDQTRGWFYTLHAISALLFDSVAYKTCVSNGLVLDKNGNKMSKRLGNVVDPFETIQTFGADATRWYLVTNASPWDNMKFDLDGIKEVQRKFFGTLYNTYQFFALYGNVDGFAFKEPLVATADRPEIDRWILSSLNSLVAKVTAYLDDYEPTHAGRLIEDFVDEHLSNWFVRLSRRRFWKPVSSSVSGSDVDKISAYQTLCICLETVVQLMAPLSPFFSDAIFRNLNEVTGRFKETSVHHTRYPQTDENLIDKDLEERMQLAQDISSMILSLRKKVNIKVRQPLQKVLIPALNRQTEARIRLVEHLIKSEVNVKEVEYLLGDTGFIRKKIKPNYVLLGKKLGSRMKAVSQAIGAFSQEDINTLERTGNYDIKLGAESISITVDEVEISSDDVPGWIVANKNGLTVALDVTVTPELVTEGNARELVNRIQKIRKDSGYELTDRIIVKVTEHEELKKTIAQFNAYICAEILADRVEIVPDIADGTEIEVNEIPLKVFVTKKA